MTWRYFADAFFVDGYYAAGYFYGEGDTPPTPVPGRDRAGGGGRPLRALVSPAPYREPPKPATVPIEPPEDEEALIMLARELL